MAVSLEDIKKLRTLTGAGLGDCKKALAEAEGNIEGAIELIRKRGQAVAAKRSDREASEGCVLVKAVPGFGAIVALKCETDFVANGADFVALTQAILDAAVENRCHTLEEVLALPMGNGTVAEAITDRSGISGEKMELDGYNVIESEHLSTYDHQGKHTLCTMVALNMEVAPEYGHAVAMQVAAMNPVALDEASVPQSVKDQEIQVAIEKTKEEQVAKAVVSALSKAGLNPNHFDSEDHIASNVAKGWITEEEAARGREVMAKAAEEKAANLPQAMIDNITRGRMQKFYKECCLVNQEFIQDSKLTVAAYLQQADKACKVEAFKRFTLRAE